MIRTTFIGIIAGLLLPTLGMGQSTGISLNLGRYPNVRSANEIIEKWNPNQHLYVKGDLGISAKQLDALETWLDQNATHWTVVLMQNAHGESYRSQEQRTYQGLDAVEYALGRGLALRTNFGDLRHPKTGETDGAVFVLFLEERKFSYYASVAQDVRSLGESRWVGELDRPAFRAMRGGGRILNAVKDTILNINERLEKRIAADLEQAEREARARQRAVVNLKTDIEALFQSIEQAQSKATALQQTLPEANGELIAPPTTDWRRQLDEVAGYLTADTVPESQDKFNEVSNQVEGFLNAYAEYDTFTTTVQEIENDIDKLNSNLVKAGRPAAKQAAMHVEAAKATRQKAEKGVGALLFDARESITQGNAAIVAEVERQKRAEARRQLIWKTLLATAALCAIAFTGVLIWLNRRRVPAMQRAEQALAEREKMVAAEMEKVYELFDRSGEILGDKERVKKRGYEGTTKKLTGNAFEDVDDLFVMSSEVERVMGEAREMIRPKKVTGKIANMVSASKFEQGVNRISGEPLEFHRDKGLPLVIQRESERTGEEPPEVVTMTFDKVFDAFHERTSTAEDTLNTIENSLLQVDDNLKALQEQIEAASALDRELSDAADDDGFFDLPALFEKLIPSAQADFDQADSLAGTDPVAAIQGQIPAGARKMKDAIAIINSVQHARKQIFPKLNEFAPQLQELEYNTNWIQQRVGSLGTEANDLVAQAVEHAVTQEAAQFDEDVRAFGRRAARTVELARELKHNAVPAIDRLQHTLDDARHAIASKLHLSAENCLKEYEADPDVHLAAASRQFAAGKAALQHGGVEAAETAQTNLHREVETGNKLVQNSLRILNEFDQILQERRQELDAVRDKVPRHEELLDEIQQAYAKSALTLQAGDATYEDASATVLTHLDGVRDALRDAQDLLDDASSKYQQGQLLKADNMLNLASQDCQESDTLLSEIAEHCSRLKKMSQQNEGKLSEIQRELQAQAALVNDARTMRPTISLYESTQREIESAQNEIRHTTPRDPFQDGREIDNFSQSIRDLAARIASDHEAHAEAARAVAGARAKREVAATLVQQARHDGIPDSPATTAGIRDVQMYDDDLARIENELRGKHNDWKKVDQAAAQIHGDLGVKVGRLRGELERAQQLVGVFQAASDAVFEATRWTGGFGTRIFGSPGSKELDRARRALNSGDYSAMAELARAAQIAAQHAIQRAQREVYRRQREEARRAEAARRQRRRNSINIGGGGGGISFPSGGGSRRSSSSRSSGSGFSRSGW